jgi:hypothetical protein
MHNDQLYFQVRVWTWIWGFCVGLIPASLGTGSYAEAAFLFACGAFSYFRAKAIDRAILAAAAEQAAKEGE